MIRNIIAETERIFFTVIAPLELSANYEIIQQMKKNERLCPERRERWAEPYQFSQTGNFDRAAPDVCHIASVATSC
jgi:hypothetical protein